MKCGNAVRPNSAPVEAWKILGNTGTVWLVELFDKIREGRIPET